MTDTPPSDGPSQGAEFDMMGALDWKDGIATLPGSDIRVLVIFLCSNFYCLCSHSHLYKQDFLQCFIVEVSLPV